MQRDFWAVPLAERPGAAEQVLAAARPLDALEIQCTSGPGDLIEKAYLFNQATRAWAYGAGPNALAVLAAHEMQAGQWSVGFCATQAWAEVGRATTRHVQRHVIPELVAMGLERAIALPLATREETQRWLAYLGFEPLADIPSPQPGGPKLRLHLWDKQQQEEWR